MSKSNLSAGSVAKGGSKKGSKRSDSPYNQVSYPKSTISDQIAVKRKLLKQPNSRDSSKKEHLKTEMALEKDKFI